MFTWMNTYNVWNVFTDSVFKFVYTGYNHIQDPQTSVRNEWTVFLVPLQNTPSVLTYKWILKKIKNWYIPPFLEAPLFCKQKIGLDLTILDILVQQLNPVVSTQAIHLIEAFPHSLTVANSKFNSDSKFYYYVIALHVFC